MGTYINGSLNLAGLLGVVMLAVGLFPAACGNDASPAAAGNGDRDGGANGFRGPPDGQVARPNPVHTNYPCDGCAPFPPIGAKECLPLVLAPPILAYPTEGILFPPNLNVLEVQFTKQPNATLYEVDFINDVTEVKVETKCTDVPNVRGGASLGCGVTIPLQAWKDVANQNRGEDHVEVTVRATMDGNCVATSKFNNIDFATEDVTGGIYYWQSAVFGGEAVRYARSGAHALPHIGRWNVRRLPQSLPRRPSHLARCRRSGRRRRVR
jgi:hypothetical protein